MGENKTSADFWIGLLAIILFLLTAMVFSILMFMEEDARAADCLEDSEKLTAYAFAVLVFGLLLTGGLPFALYLHVDTKRHLEKYWKSYDSSQ